MINVLRLLKYKIWKLEVPSNLELIQLTAANILEAEVLQRFSVLIEMDYTDVRVD